MNSPSTTVASTPGVMLIRVGQAGSALRWDALAQCWRWPDPIGSQLYAWPAPPAMPSGVRMLESASVMACCTSGRVLLGLGKRLGMVELPQPGQPSRPLQAQVLITIDAAEPRTSISDGCADRAGNFVFGTANTGQDKRPIGSFYQYSQRYGLRRLALPAVAAAASIAFSPDGRRMVFADAARGAIMQCDYEPERAKVSVVKPFSELLEQGAGAAIFDSDGNLWSVQGGVLVQYDSHGHALQQVALAREAAASVAFGGPGLDQLLVLGAQGGLYGLPPGLLKGLAPGVADTLFIDSGSASTASLHA
ncbi:Sugar lactone lactonase YvrE [Duganella sp. CF402]|uniref:SMP-30/gluconolactonase/LRE family protein n=1 Tax=unclassified Duganella TaxID=2636909 RepID=UPI0008C50B7F|nr:MULTISPECIES: SMP-30/gluconolactonase/LRE family protein [unclassified Duganella]RZT08860.1 L-arabinonolactonase [Duganella sp. BK701]SEL79126.1 Sugar lactone lactonase YvrE [Duganella sp. CF402]